MTRFLLSRNRQCEHLVRVVAHAGPADTDGCRSRLDGIASAARSPQITPRQFQHRLATARTWPVPARRRAEPRLIQFQQLTQAFMLLEHVRARSTALQARYADPQKNRQQFGIRRAAAPRRSSFSRGRSLPGQSRMDIAAHSFSIDNAKHGHLIRNKSRNCDTFFDGHPIASRKRCIALKSARASLSAYRSRYPAIIDFKP